MNRDEIRRYLDDRGALAPGTKIQYGHPSPRFWRRRATPLSELLEPLVPARPLALYIHIPFCVRTEPSACGFCLFAREELGRYTAVSDYVETLLIELDQVADLVGRWSLGALYFGGGTPNTLRAPEIRRIFERVHARFDLEPDAEVTFEGYPPLFTPDRLEALRELGCNRISLGVQTLDPKLLAHSGRDVALQQTIDAIDFCTEHGIRSNVDLITGWFDQTPDDVAGDARQLIEWGVNDICNHLLAIAGNEERDRGREAAMSNSEFALRAGELPTNAVMAEVFGKARQAMLGLGFRSDSYCDYSASDWPVVRYLDMYRDVLNNDRIGVGYGANSLLAGTLANPGRTWKNVADLDEYRARVRSGRSAVGECFEFASEDLRLLHVLKGLEGTPWLSTEGYAVVTGGDLKADFAPWWDVLEDRGWLRWEGSSPVLVDDGVYYTALIQRSIAEPRNRVLRNEAPASEVARGQVVQLGATRG